MMQIYEDKSGPQFKRMKPEYAIEELEQAVGKRGFVTMPMTLVWNILQIVKSQAAEIERLKTHAQEQGADAQR